MEKLLANLSRNLKSLREKKGLSQQALSERSGLDRTYIGKIERGDRVPSLGTIVKIASGIGIEPHKLLRSSEEESAGSENEENVALFDQMNEQIERHFRMIEGLVEDVSDDPAVSIDVLRRTSQHFTTLSELYRLLLARYSSEKTSDSENDPIQDFLGDVVERTRQTIERDNKYRGVSLVRNLSTDVRLAPADAVSCGLVVHELVTNSFQHGFHSDDSGRVEVSFKTKETGNRFLLAVSDDGAGDVDRSALDGTLSGLSIVKQLVIEDLHGAVSIDNTEEESRFSVSFSRQDIVDTDPEQAI